MTRPVRRELAESEGLRARLRGCFTMCPGPAWSTRSLAQGCEWGREALGARKINENPKQYFSAYKAEKTCQNKSCAETPSPPARANYRRGSLLLLVLLVRALALWPCCALLKSRRLFASMFVRQNSNLQTERILEENHWIRRNYSFKLPSTSPFQRPFGRKKSFDSTGSTKIFEHSKDFLFDVTV